jgi:hypothetical protein
MTGLVSFIEEAATIGFRMQKIAPEGTLRPGGACFAQGKNGDQ